jgi:hypothetical protein
MALATSSFPVPLSPWMSTVEVVEAMERTRSKSFTILGDTPIIRSRRWSERNSAFRRRFSS